MSLESLLGKYDECQLECDGMTRVLHTVLEAAGYPHTVKVGSIALGSKTFSPHFWIELADGRIVDYRARMWLGEHAPHGIFRRSQAVYEGERVDLEILSNYMFKILTGGI